MGGLLIFNGRGLLWSAACGVAAFYLSEAIARVGHLGNQGGLPWFLALWSQMCATVALWVDRSDETGFWRAYHRHASEVAHGVRWFRGHPKPAWYVPNPARRVLFCWAPLASYPFAMLLVVVGFAAWQGFRDGRFELAEHPFYVQSTALLIASCSLTLGFAHLTRARRLVPAPERPAEPAERPFAWKSTGWYREL